MYHKFVDRAKPLRRFVKPFLVVLFIYLIAMFAILRANYSYIDDVGRATVGYAWNADFGRKSSSLLSYILNTNFKLSDISPLTQVMATAILSVANIIVTYAYCGRKIKYAPLIMSCFLGLTPFMLALWVYKFDAPCMAISILASTVPLVCWRQLRIANRCSVARTIVVTIACQFVMWTTYQASSGILPVLLLGVAFIDLIHGEKFTKTITKTLPYLAAYIVAAIIFRLLFMRNSTGYRDTGILTAADFINGVINNIYNYAMSIAGSLNVYWGVLIMLTVCIFVVSVAIYRYKNKHHIKDVLVGVVYCVVFILLAVPLSYGVYSLLNNAPTNGRSLIGIATVFMVVAIVPAILMKGACKLVVSPSVILLWSFIVYATALGNGLSSQKDYANFRLTNLAGELSSVSDIKLDGKTKLNLDGGIGYSAELNHVRNLYPVTSRVMDIESGLDGLSTWGYRRLIVDYGVNVKEDLSKSVKCHHEIKSTIYEDILSDKQGNICVKLNPLTTSVWR